MRDKRKVQQPAPPPHQHRLKRYSIFYTSYAGINDPEGPEKYSNTVVKYGKTN
jgi:hypothetical protein